MISSVADRAIYNIFIMNFNSGIWSSKSGDFGIGKMAGISGSQNPWINSLGTQWQCPADSGTGPADRAVDCTLA